MLLLATFWLACLALFLELVHRPSPLPVPDPRGENEPKTPNLSQRAPTVSLGRQREAGSTVRALHHGADQ